MNQTTRPADSQPIPHAALQRAGFRLTVIGKASDTDPASVWQRLSDDGTELYHIHRHGENKAPHRWSHRVDVYVFIDRTCEWDKAAENIPLADAIARYGQPSPASPEVAP